MNGPYKISEIAIASESYLNSGTPNRVLAFQTEGKLRQQLFAIRKIP